MDKLYDVVRTLQNVDMTKIGSEGAESLAKTLRNTIKCGDVIKIKLKEDGFFKINFKGTKWRMFREHFALKVILNEGVFIVDFIHDCKMVPYDKYKQDLADLNDRKEFIFE